MPCKNNIPFKSPEIASRMIEEESVIVVPKDSRVIVLNAVGTCIWGLIDGQRDFKAIARAIAGDFEVEPNQAEEDVVSFLKELSVKGLVAFKE